ncbi:MAG TPA: phenylalanine--tRNA ligase subunit beta [Bacillota bacterium]|nr:phenylalanine--tRNA ligase subunit beta [Bacillota bacterium]
MAIITFNKKQFERDFGKLNDAMQNKIARFGTPIESIQRDDVYLEIFPNRPDLLSYHGFKRAFLSFLGKKTKLKEYHINKPEKNYDVIIDSSVKNIRPYTTCAIAKGIQFNDEKIKELVEMQEKLHMTIGRKRKKIAIGIYPLEKIKLPITFKAIEPDKIKFIPLEMNRELSGLEILQRHPAGKEYAHLLAGKTKFSVFIDADKQILSMPPIINSHLTGKITSQTRDIFIECSGEDFETLKTCLNIIITCLDEMGGKIYQMNLHYGKKEITPDLTPKKIKVSLKNTNQLLGLELKEKEFKKLIEKMGHNYNLKNNSVEVASWRTDVLHEVDIIEDVAIAYGYENFIPEIPEIATTGREDEKEVVKKKLSEILSGLGMVEVSNYHLTNKKNQIEKMNLVEKQEEFIEVKESKTEQDILRKNLTHLLLKNFSENIDSEYPQQIFEIGKVFCIKTEKGNIIEKEMLAAAISPGNFTKIKQIFEYLFRMLGKEIEKELIFKEPTEISSYFIGGRTAEIIFKGEKIGFIGEIHPKILKNWKIKMPVALFEIECILEEFL